MSDDDLSDSISASPVKQRSPPLFLEDEDKTAEATSKFEVLDSCTYSSKTIGSSGQQEYMTCDCTEEWDSTTQRNMACSDESNCINRVTSVECINGHCGCGSDCQNQRFQNKQFASVSVFQTELKGYGLRADKIIPESSFIYEYIGEVIDETSFRKRMIDYDQKNFKHFYFMMLKNDSFIDATVKGSLARFCNHSCNPNAYVDKWVVGEKLRMGIFSKRAIQKGEEITFDYNVDRYGAQSQPCYCGEPNCIKFMGGKTQTDAALLLPDGISEALGVTAKQEKQWLKENKHLRSKQQGDDAIINEQFVRTLEVEPLTEIDVSKVMGALMKSQDLQIIKRLVERIFKTSDDSINSLIIRFHGYKTLSTIIKQFKDDDDALVEDILTILGKWPKFTRNKISSSQIENVIKDIESNTSNTTIKSLSSELLEAWGNLQMAYRIPKTKAENQASLYGRKGSRSPRSPRQISVELEGEDKLPDGWEVAFDKDSNSKYYFHRDLNISTWDRPASSVPIGPKSSTAESTNGSGSVTSAGTGSKKSGEGFRGDQEYTRREEERLRLEKEQMFSKLQDRERELQEMILQSGEEQRKKQIEERNKVQEKIRLQKEKMGLRAKTKSKSTPSSKSATISTKSRQEIEAKWTHVLAKHVPNFIKKYEAEIARDNIKGCARDLVKTLVSKEMRKEPPVSPPKELDNHKLKKIKDYSKVFMEKFLVKYRLKQGNNKRSAEDDKTDVKKVKQ